MILYIEVFQHEFVEKIVLTVKTQNNFFNWPQGVPWKSPRAALGNSKRSPELWGANYTWTQKITLFFTRAKLLFMNLRKRVGVWENLGGPCLTIAEDQKNHTLSKYMLIDTSLVK